MKTLPVASSTASEVKFSLRDQLQLSVLAVGFVLDGLVDLGIHLGRERDMR